MRGERNDQRRKNGQGDGEEHHDGCIDTGKTGDEGLALRLPFASILHKVDDLGNGTLAKGLRGAHFQHTREVDTAGNDLIAYIDIARQRLTCQCDGIEGGCALDNHTIQRHLLPRANHDDRTDVDCLWADISDTEGRFFCYIVVD